MVAPDDWPTIWRCAVCGSIVHPADEQAAVASCSRCRGIMPARKDGGPPD